MEWYRNDKAAVAEALRRGERPDLATTMASGPLDELVTLHQELGIFAILDELEVQRARAGVPDEVLLRTLATLPFVEAASLPRGQRGLVPRTSGALAVGLGPGANPLGQQWTTSAPRWATRRVLALSPRYVTRCAAACRGVRVAARASSRSAGPLSAAVGAGQGLRRRGPRARR